MSKGDNRSWLSPFLRPLRRTLAEVLAMSFFVNLLALALPVFTLQVYDRVIGHQGFSTLQGLVIGMLLVLFFDFALRQARSRIMQTVALRIDVLVGRELFRKFTSLPLHVLEARTSNQWQALFRDVDVVRNTLSGASAVLICDIPFAVLFLALILTIAAPVAWVLVVVLPIFMFVAWRSAGVMAAANKEERKSSMTRDGLIAEMIAGRSTIKALALDRAMGPLWEDTHAANIETAIVRGSRTDLYQNVGASLTMLTTVAMSSVGAIAIITQNMTMGALVASNMLSSRLLGPLNQLVGQWRSFSSFKQSVERLGEIFAMEGERQESELKLGQPKGEIVAEQVVFSYAKDLAPVVDNVSVTIKAGGIHALVGRNGSGKTTLLKLLMGLYRPTSGRVLLDGADIVQFTRAELATWIGYVPQDCVLFAGSVRDNIAYRSPGATDEQIIKAATAAGVHHFIIDLPDGYATEIGEAGRRLSGGQRQRIAIARALVGDPSVIMLDEPSSSLDRQAEQELRNTLVEIGKEHTVVIVTHSPILLAACDDLVALDRGKIALAGPSKEILPRLFGQAPVKSDAAPVAQASAGGAASAPHVSPQGQARPVPLPPPAPARGAPPPAGASAPALPQPRPPDPRTGAAPARPAAPQMPPHAPPPVAPAGSSHPSPLPPPRPPMPPPAAPGPTLPPPRPPAQGALPAPRPPAPPATQAAPPSAPRPLPSAPAAPPAAVPSSIPRPPQAPLPQPPRQPQATPVPPQPPAAEPAPRLQGPAGTPRPSAPESAPQQRPAPPAPHPPSSPATTASSAPVKPRMPLPPVAPPATRRPALPGPHAEAPSPTAAGRPQPAAGAAAPSAAPAPAAKPAAPSPPKPEGDPYTTLAQSVPRATTAADAAAGPPAQPKEPQRGPNPPGPAGGPSFGRAPRLPAGGAAVQGAQSSAPQPAANRPRLPGQRAKAGEPAPTPAQTPPAAAATPRAATPGNGTNRPPSTATGRQPSPDAAPSPFRAPSAGAFRAPAAPQPVAMSGLFGRHAGTELFADDLEEAAPLPVRTPPRPQAERKP